MNTGLLLKTDNTIHEVTLDMSLYTNNISLLLNDKLTFLGQLLREPIHTNAVIIYGANSHKNNLPKNTLIPKPFHNNTIYGDIFIISMDHNSEPQNFTIQDYNEYNLNYDNIYKKYYFD